MENMEMMKCRKRHKETVKTQGDAALSGHLILLGIISTVVRKAHNATQSQSQYVFQHQKKNVLE